MVILLEYMRKSNWKGHLVGRLKIASFVFALVGIFMLVVVPQEVLLHKDFSNLEQAVETVTFKWVLKIFVVIFLIVLVKGQKFLNSILERYVWLKTVLKVIYLGGAVGWVVGLGSLVLP